MRVAAVTERSIDRDLAGFWIERGENFSHHDRSMRPRRRFPGCDHFPDRFGITPGLMLFVFILETARIFPAVTHPARRTFG